MHKNFVKIPPIVKSAVDLCFYIIRHPRKFYKYNILRRFVVRFSRLYSDRKYLKIVFPWGTGYELNIDHPQTFNEKLQWLKLNYHRPEFSLMVDKAEAKKYVAEIIGEDHIIPTLGVYNSVNEINFRELPEQFVLKCTHDSGDLIICKDKSKLDREKVFKQLKRGLKFDYFYMGREWVYKSVKHRIIAEKFMTDNGDELKDYKIFNFGGEPKIIEVDFDRFKDHKRHLYTPDWKRIDATFIYRWDDSIIERPKLLEQMLEFAKKLSKGHPFIRTDFYVINEKVYFGELTFYHDNGFGKICPFEFDLEMGKWIKLPEATTGTSHRNLFFAKASTSLRRFRRRIRRFQVSIKRRKLGAIKKQNNT